MINMENMLELMNEEAEIKDKQKALAFKPPPKGVDVNFENVSFHYDPRQPILKNVSFTVPAGKTLAIVGQSGSGKSTIVKLLLRFYDPESGRVVIGGQDIKTVSQSSLRTSIGFVPQGWSRSRRCGEGGSPGGHPRQDCLVARWLRNQGWGAWAKNQWWKEAESGNCKNFTQVSSVTASR